MKVEILNPLQIRLIAESDDEKELLDDWTLWKGFYWTGYETHRAEIIALKLTLKDSEL